MGVTVLTESRREMCKSSGAQEDLADDRSKTAVIRVEWRGTHMEYATRNGLVVLGLKTIGWTGSEKGRTARGGIEEFVSRRSYLMKGVVVFG
jgi:hypothetical protein